MTLPKKRALLLIALFALMNGASLTITGTHLAGDSSIYMGGASNLLHHQPLEIRQSAYAGYVGIVATFQTLHLGVTGLIAFQILVSLLAMGALFRLGDALGGPTVGTLAAVLFALNPEIAKWNCYVLTDSLYISTVILTAFAIHQASLRGGRWYGLAAVLALGGALLRPNGWVLLPIFAMYCILVRVRGRLPRVIATAAVAVAFALVAFSFSGHAMHNREPDIMLQRGEVVWNYPAGRLAMPYEPPPIRHGWGATLAYSAHHPLAVARLCGWRVVLSLAHARPFYARAHNLMLLVLAPFYLLVILGARAARRQPLTWLLLVIAGAHLAMVAISYADWDGRFLLYFWPLLAVLCARGLAAIFAVHPEAQTRAMAA